MKPFFTYYGGKYRIAPRYPKPRWVTVVEPFAGSAGYSVRHYRHRIILVEVNPKVFGTWEYLIRSTSEEILRLPLVFDDVRDLPICQEAKWLIGWWLNKGHTQPCNIPGLWMRQGTRPNSFWGEVIRDRIASQVDSIKHWKVYEKTYLDLEIVDKATWFIDPPYQKSGRCYTYNLVDYDRLREWTLGRRGQVIACGQEGDDWLPFKPFIETRGTPGYKRPGTSKEVIYYAHNT